MKYRNNPTLIDTHLQVLKSNRINTIRCGRCNRILPHNWHGRLCSKCSLKEVKEVRNDR